MTSDAFLGVGAVAGVIIAYGLLRLRLITATQSFRIAAACEADDMIDDSRVPEKGKNLLAKMVESAFDSTIPWKFLYRTVKALVFSKQIKLGHIIEFEDSDFAKRFDRVARKMMFANAMTSPLAALLLWAVLGISLLICASTYKLSGVIENIAETMHSPPNNGNGVQGHARANP